MVIDNRTKTKIIEYVIDRYEGGYVNDPNDKGGETKYGITKATYPNLDIKNLTKEQAVNIYKRHYWGSSLDSIAQYTSDKLTEKVFAFAINAGVGTSVKAIQRALNNLTDNSLKVDGIWGPKSKEALKTLTNDGQNTSNIIAFQCTLFVEMIAHYFQLCIKKPSQKTFLMSWLRRIFD